MRVGESKSIMDDREWKFDEEGWVVDDGGGGA
jgi:hypothetical protein